MALIKDKGRMLLYDAKSVEGVNGARGKLFRANELMEHFNTFTTLPAPWTLTEDGTPVSAAAYGAGLGGTAVLTTDDVAAKQESITGPLLWQADRQPTGVPLVFECKVQLGATITSVELWCGFTDAVADTAPYALSSTSTFTTSVPTDAALVGFSTTPTSGAAYTAGGNNHVAIATIADSNQVVATGRGAFAASTYYTYRVEIDSAGNVAFFVDHQFLGGAGLAITPTVPLCPIVTVIPRTTSERIATIDYIYVGGK